MLGGREDDFNFAYVTQMSPWIILTVEIWIRFPWTPGTLNLEWICDPESSENSSAAHGHLWL